MRSPLLKLSRSPLLLLGGLLLVAAILLGVVVGSTPEVSPVPTQPPPPAKPPEIPAPIPLPDHATAVLELFSPSDQMLTHQLNETNISQHIEQVMATSYILANCHVIDTDTYRDSFRALIVYAQRTKLAANATEAEAKVRTIAGLAGASYSLLYRRTKCDSPRLPVIAQQLVAWQKAYLE